MNTEEKKYELEPVVEVMKYSKVNNGDVIILRCEAGKENEEISKMHSKLKSLIVEKNLRILAINPEFSMDRIFLALEAAKNFEEDMIDKVNE
jgi:hypothetical protein